MKKTVFHHNLKKSEQTFGKKKEIEIRMEDKKTEKIKDDNLNLSFVKISKNLNLG